jgi:hypothetical protein
MNTAANRRKYMRHTALFSAKYIIQAGRFRDLIKNIGSGGVFISTRRKIDTAQPINLQIPIFAFEKWLSLMGTVVRCNSEGFAVEFDEAIDEKLFKTGQRRLKCAEDSSDLDGSKS